MQKFFDFIRGLKCLRRGQAEMPKPQVLAQAQTEPPLAELPAELPPLVHFLGTSNFALRESIIKYFREASGWQGMTRGIGGCSSALGLYSYSMLPKPQGRTSFVVIDFLINDAQILRKGMADLEALLQNLRDLVFALRQDGHIPLLMLLPAREFFEGEDRLERAQLALAQELGLFYWNLAEIFRDLCAKGLPRAAFMRDTAHMSPEACALTGQRLAACLKRIAETRRGQIAYSDAVRCFRKLAAADLAEGHEILTLSNSLVSTALLRLETGDHLRLPLPEGECLAAVMFNMGASGAVAAFSNGMQEVSKSLIMYWHADKPEIYSLILADFFTVLEGRGEDVILRLMPQDYPTSEPMLHGRPPLPDRYGQLEIEGFLLRSLRKDMRETGRETYAGLPLDLAHFAETADFAEAQTALARAYAAKEAEMATAG